MTDNLIKIDRGTNLLCHQKIRKTQKNKLKSFNNNEKENRNNKLVFKFKVKNIYQKHYHLVYFYLLQINLLAISLIKI